jgi:hypothetical protein
VFVDSLSLISPESDVRRKAVQRLSDLISVTAEVGAEMINGPPDAPVGYLPGGVERMTNGPGQSRATLSGSSDPEAVTYQHPPV